MPPNPPRFTHNRLFGLLAFGLFIVCPLLFFIDLTRNPYYTQIALLNLFVSAAWIFWFWEAWKNKEFVWVFSPLDGPLLALCAACLLSWIVAFFRHPALAKPIYSEGSKGIIFLITNTYLVYAAAVRSQNRMRLRWVLWMTYIAASAASIYGIQQYFGVEWIWPHSLNPYGSRPVSTFGNPNFMSSYLVMIIPVILADALVKATGVPRVILLAAGGFCTAVLAATLTRSSWAGLLAALIIVGTGFWRDKSFRKISPMFAAAVLAGLVLIFALWPKGDVNGETVADRFSEIRALSQGQPYGPVSQRLLIWTAAFTMAEESPVVGNGWGCFELFYPFYQGPLLLEKAFRVFRTHANNAHNEILEYWSQAGTLGLGLVVLIWIVFFRSAISMARRIEGPWRALFWGMTAGVAGMLVDNLLNVSVHFAVPAMVFWWWVGSVFIMDPASLRERRIDLRRWWGAPLVGLVIAGLMLLMMRAVCLEMMEVNFFDGFKHSKRGELADAARALESAYAWHHLEVNNNYELGNVYARLGQRERAVAMYQRSLDANAGYDEIYFNRATMEMQMGRIPDAIIDYRTCLAINPLSHDAYGALASLYLKDLSHNGDAAEALYDQGVIAFPDDRDMWNNLGYLYTQRGKWDQAADAYRRALVIDPKYVTAQNNLQVVLPHLKNR